MVDDAGDLEPLAADDLVQRGATLLDVREPEEFDAGHAPAARLLPLGNLDAHHEDLHGDEVVCVCRTGSRSAIAAEFLRGRGVRAHNLVGGMQAWATEGLPIVTAQGGSGTIL